jgi:hypothetical protein
VGNPGRPQTSITVRCFIACAFAGGVAACSLRRRLVAFEARHERCATAGPRPEASPSSRVSTCRTC